jgi:hypothetical protein
MDPFSEEKEMDSRPVRQIMLKDTINRSLESDVSRIACGTNRPFKLARGPGTLPIVRLASMMKNWRLAIP